MLQLSFREKSILGSLVTLLALFGYYFRHVFGGLASGQTPDLAATAVMGIGLLIALIVIEIVYHIFISAISPDEAQEVADERGQLIAAKAGRNAGVVLAVGAYLVVGHLFANSLVGREEWITPFVTAHLILVALVLAQTTEYLSELVYYRLGV